MAIGAQILTEIAESTAAGRVLVSDEYSQSPWTPGEPEAYYHLGLSESLRAAALFFDVTVDALAGHATNDPALLQCFVTCVLALNASLNRRIRRITVAYVGQLLDHIQQAQLDERRRIARELHDRLGEGLSVALRQLELREISGPQQPAAIDHRPSVVKDAIVATMGRLREVTSDLRQEPVTSLGKALARYLDFAAADANVCVRISGDEKWASPAVLDQVFLIIREALRNALTHAEPRLVKVTADVATHALRASVHDDGHGFVPPDGDRGPAPTAGLASMRERAALIGGTLTISSAPGRGAHIDLYVPLPGPRDD